MHMRFEALKHINMFLCYLILLQWNGLWNPLFQWLIRYVLVHFAVLGYMWQIDILCLCTNPWHCCPHAALARFSSVSLALVDLMLVWSCRTLHWAESDYWLWFLLSVSSPSRLQLPQHGGVRGLCAFLCGDGRPLLPLHGRSGAWRWVRLLPDTPQPFLLIFLSLPVPLILPAWGLSESCHVQELEEVPGSVHGNSDVHELHPGEGAMQTGPQRYWSLIIGVIT